MANISVVDPIAWAMSRTGTILFRPLRFKRWLVLGIAACLAFMQTNAESVLNLPRPSMRVFGFSTSLPPGLMGTIQQTIDNTYLSAWNWSTTHLTKFTIILMAVACVWCGWYVLMTWLNCRGQFMMFDSVVRLDYRPKRSWRDNRELGNNLLKFRIYYDLAWFNVYLVLGIIGFALTSPDWKTFLNTGNYPMSAWTISAIILVALGIAGSLLLQLFFAFVINYVMLPVMYVKRIRAWPAFKEALWRLVKPNLGACLLYFLMLFAAGVALGMGAMIAALALAIVTCCIGTVLSYIPVLHLLPFYVIAVATLPVSIFIRTYSLSVLGQFGPEYQAPWQWPLPGGFPVIMDTAKDAEK